MTPKSGVVPFGVDSAVQPATVAWLADLSALLAIGVIGLCVSLMSITLTDGEWLVAIQNIGF